MNSSNKKTITKNPDQERLLLNFESNAKSSFAFLKTLGFKKINSLPTLVQYKKDNNEIDVYHGRLSYEIGFEITRNGVEYSLGSFIKAADPIEGEKYRLPCSTTLESVTRSLKNSADLVKRYCLKALQDDQAVYTDVEIKRKIWMEKYWLQMDARQLRPEAHEAFRLDKYKEAAEIYKQFIPLLSPVEIKKLAIAEERNKNKWIIKILGLMKLIPSLKAASTWKILACKIGRLIKKLL